jgi:hypothetical protein
VVSGALIEQADPIDRLYSDSTTGGSSSIICKNRELRTLQIAAVRRFPVDLMLVRADVSSVTAAGLGARGSYRI